MDYKIKGETLTDIADAIREKTGSTETMAPEGMASKVDAVYEAGKEQGVYEWWDKYHNWYSAVDMTDWMYAFAGSCWDDSVYNPIRPVNATARTTGMFAYSNVTDTKVPISIAGETSTNKGGTFMNATKLVTVREFNVNEVQSMHQQFTNCAQLQNLVISGTIAKDAYFQWCPLTPESMISVITHLKNFTGTGSEYSTTLQFSDDCWAALEEHSTAPDGGTWRDYVENVLCWNT